MSDDPLPPLAGLHHVTAIAGPPQRNLAFWTGVMGLRLVKQTVNFDDPASYHLYYGDARGTPGTVLTFFPWIERPLIPLPRGRAGTGMATVAQLAVAPGALDFWIDRLVRNDVDFDAPARRFGEEVLAFTDPDGLRVELVAHPGAEERTGWAHGSVPSDHGVRGLHGVTLSLERTERTAAFLREVMGFRAEGVEDGCGRFTLGEGAGAARVDLLCRPEAVPGTMGVGAIHHVAWRVADAAAQARWRERLLEAGVDVSPVMDRKYFTSLYFREPGGVLFEIATDGPGFTADEPAERLGAVLQLPEWLEGRRSRILATLPVLEPPLPAGWRPDELLGGSTS